jgi:hypothetical protein
VTTPDLALVCVPSCDGLTTAYVDLALCRAATKPMCPGLLKRLTQELIVATAADRVRRERTVRP